LFRSDGVTMPEIARPSITTSHGSDVSHLMMEVTDESAVTR
jgi:hypothetical protein